MFATAQDVATELATELSPAQVDLANAKIAALEAVIRLRIPDILMRTTAQPDLRILTGQIVAAAVARVLRNPDGKIQEAIDDYSFRRTDAADGSLSLTDVEWAMLMTTPNVSPTAAFTITPGGYRDPRDLDAPGHGWR